MTDHLSRDRRSANMRAIRHKDTSPEMLVRRLLTQMRYRYRLHVKTLPGKPDLVFLSRRKVVFVHGCFWHQHSCPAGHKPLSNSGYWGPKLAGNLRRDALHVAELKARGFDVMVIWECETKNEGAVARRLRKFLGPKHREWDAKRTKQRRKR